MKDQTSVEKEVNIDTCAAADHQLPLAKQPMGRSFIALRACKSENPATVSAHFTH